MNKEIPLVDNNNNTPLKNPKKQTKKEIKQSLDSHLNFTNI
jgi:hypothetical protein